MPIGCVNYVNLAKLLADTRQIATVQDSDIGLSPGAVPEVMSLVSGFGCHPAVVS